LHALKSEKDVEGVEGKKPTPEDDEPKVLRSPEMKEQDPKAPTIPIPQPQLQPQFQPLPYQQMQPQYQTQPQGVQPGQTIPPTNYSEDGPTGTSKSFKLSTKCMQITGT
jgi:hypothetical protein